jgi:ribonuclease P protein component
METIKSPREIDRIFREARRVAHPHIVALVARTPEGRGLHGRVAFVAGRRIGGAVQRNRAKRVLREAARRTEFAREGYDVVLIARERTGRCSAGELDAALRTIAERAGIS